MFVTLAQPDNDLASARRELAEVDLLRVTMHSVISHRHERVSVRLFYHSHHGSQPRQEAQLSFTRAQLEDTRK